MEATTYSNFRQNLKKYMHSINENSNALIVTSKDNKDIVAISKSDYDNLMENLYLLSSETNRNYINESIEQFENEDYETLSLDEI
ncbi:antitoxin YefM [Anaerosphaera aminiphila DSM 21120]|uniref:Antitoxin n=1 Tax=Anaerosphaera aminiphila DSM 21120 TaxID=1120995 RepID=A0A1M5PLR3_9FIRM|nr:type II toxin-antitoxin system Phd/YefM family antitoxin [Anaerosphaera aminiphila]SHH02702.1 antitoxin YefM [Anaerosphaera aminiphila DSM 21120]